MTPINAQSSSGPDQTGGAASGAALRVLLVEDAPIVALDVQQLLEQEGFVVIGPALNLEEGLRLAAAHGADLDWAVLDFDLGGRTAAPIADVLAHWSVPIIWCSGFSHKADPAFLRGFHLQKPIDHAQLVSLLRNTKANTNG